VTPPDAAPPITVVESHDGLSFDPEEAVAHLRRVDRVLGRFIDSSGPFALQLDHTQSIFMALAEAIVYQQLTGRAAATIFGRVRALVAPDGGVFTAEAILRLTEEQLRGAGLSRNKALSMLDLAARTVSGELPTLDDVRDMDDEQIIARLVAVRGIGRWTAQMLLMFRLGRPDVLPVDDYGVRKGFAAVFRKRTLPTREELAKRGARWSPYRSVASWYLWRAVEVQTPGATAYT
jgi:3-methyladenine DNA glycosylase/8-oxoguanine DNA glycosylase